jgi:hypothetical protein
LDSAAFNSSIKFVDVDELANQFLARNSPWLSSFNKQISLNSVRDIYAAQLLMLKMNCNKLFIDEYMSYNVNFTIIDRLAAGKNKTTQVVKTSWADKQLLSMKWDILFFVDQNPEVRVKRLMNVGFDQYLAERFIDIQFSNVYPALERSTLIFDDFNSAIKEAFNEA